MFFRCPKDQACVLESLSALHLAFHYSDVLFSDVLILWSLSWCRLHTGRTGMINVCISKTPKSTPFFYLSMPVVIMHLLVLHLLILILNLFSQLNLHLTKLPFSAFFHDREKLTALQTDSKEAHDSCQMYVSNVSIVAVTSSRLRDSTSKSGWEITSTLYCRVLWVEVSSKKYYTAYYTVLIWCF